MGTVCPSLTFISFSTPAEGEGISASTLSVEISKSGSSRSTLSPGFFSHLVMVPSKILSPIWGITMSTAMCVLLETCEPEVRKSKLEIRNSKIFPARRGSHHLCGGAQARVSVLLNLIPRQLLRGGENFLRVGQKILFERRRVR